MRKKKIAMVLIGALMAVSLGACSSQATEESKKGDAVSAILPDVAEVELLSVNSEASIAEMKTDGMENPTGLDDETPAFSWKMESAVTGAAQSAYQITVKDESGKSVWDSGVVESRESVDIPYAGEALAAQTKYTWQVTVTDTGNQIITSDEAAFETGLMSDSFDAWNGAKWIGADSLSLDASSTCVFKISTMLQIAEGSNAASLILGANDYRFQNSNFNINAMNSENYVRLELDISDVTSSGGAKINAYRVGYAEGDLADTPMATLQDLEDLNALITSANAHENHELTVSVCASKITFTIDGTELKDSIVVNDLGGDSSYNTYPNLNSVGFAANA